MLLAIYSLLLGAACLCAVPLLPVLLLVPAARRGLLERLGVLPGRLADQAWMAEGCLWVHAASLGEVNAVAPVVRELLPRMPRQALVVTCTTVAGREQARRLFPQAAACLLLPLDLPPLIGPWVRRFRPRLVLVAETEWWPNFLRILRSEGARVIVANGRLTERSFRGYARLGGFFRRVLEDVDLFAMQSEEDAGRVVALGARRARVVVAGNTKFDISGEPPARADELLRGLGWEGRGPVVVAGSVRAGEEAVVADAFARVREAFPEARMVLAPRHQDRIPAAAAALRARRLAFRNRSRGEAPDQDPVLVLDTLGELRSFYALAAGGGLAWVGGGFADFGGQNPLEPAALGVPVLFGPHMRHFREAAEALLGEGAALQVPSGSLGAESVRLLRDPSKVAAMGQAGARCVRERSGASKATADLAWKLLLVSDLSGKAPVWREEGLAGFRQVSETGGEGEVDWRDEGPQRLSRGGEFGARLGRGDDDPPA